MDNITVAATSSERGSLMESVLRRMIGLSDGRLAQNRNCGRRSFPGNNSSPLLGELALVRGCSLVKRG